MQVMCIYTAHYKQRLSAHNLLRVNRFGLVGQQISFSASKDDCSFRTKFIIQEKFLTKDSLSRYTFFFNVHQCYRIPLN